MCSFALNIYTSHISNEKQLNFIDKIQIVKNAHKTRIMIDIEIFVSSFVNEKFVRLFKLFTITFVKFIKLRLTNNELINNITHMTQVKFSMTEHVIEFWCLIISLNQFDLILEMLWLKQHDVAINFKVRSLTFENDYCLKHCIHNYQLTIMYSNESKNSKNKKKKKTRNMT